MVADATTVVAVIGWVAACSANEGYTVAVVAAVGMEDDATAGAAAQAVMAEVAEAREAQAA